MFDLLGNVIPLARDTHGLGMKPEGVINIIGNELTEDTKDVSPIR